MECPMCDLCDIPMKRLVDQKNGQVYWHCQRCDSLIPSKDLESAPYDDVGDWNS